MIGHALLFHHQGQKAAISNSMSNTAIRDNFLSIASPVPTLFFKAQVKKDEKLATAGAIQLEYMYIYIYIYIYHHFLHCNV